jgi:hypothetical protein
MFPPRSLTFSSVRFGHSPTRLLAFIVGSSLSFVTFCWAFSLFGSTVLQGAPTAPTVTEASQPMKTYVIMRRSGWDSPADLSKAAARSSAVGQQEMSDRVRWIRSYVTDEGSGRVGTVCVYQATDEESLREHARRADLPCDTIVAVGDTVVINPDPAPAR